VKNEAKILIVDDDEVVRLSHLRSLRNDHCNVELASNGAEALRVMEKQPFDAVLLDLRMPGMDGMQVLKMIKQRWPHCEVIVVTGYPSLETAKEAVRLGAYDYLAKPVGPDDIVNAAHCAVTHKQWGLRRNVTNDDDTKSRAHEGDRVRDRDTVYPN